MPNRTANAVWEGDLKSGKGRMKLPSGAYEGPFTFESRFAEGKGTNPEELLGAAHAGCFSMALSHMLSEAGFKPEKVETTAEVSLNAKGDGFEIGSIKLTTRAKISGIDPAKFAEIAEKAKTGCPVSKALASVKISLDAKLE